MTSSVKALIPFAITLKFWSFKTKMQEDSDPKKYLDGMSRRKISSTWSQGEIVVGTDIIILFVLEFIHTPNMHETLCIVVLYYLFAHVR